MQRFALRLGVVFYFFAATFSRAVLVPATAAAQSHSITSPPTFVVAVPRNDLPGLPNFAQVSTVLYRGAQPSAEGIQRLKAMGIKTIINLRSLHGDDGAMNATGLRYIHIPCKAWHPEEEDFVAFLKAVSDPANQPVFVHCAKGCDRTGEMVAGYRIVVQKWSLSQAMREMDRFGFHSIFVQITFHLHEMNWTTLAQKVASAPQVPVEIVR